MGRNILRDTGAIVKLFCEKYVNEDTVAIDATCGNGNDTLWLAERCAKVYAFDIQRTAIESAEKLISESGLRNVTFINDSHGNMAEYVKQPPEVIIFNLGYLPGGDKNITTDETTTLKALKSAAEMVTVNGVVCVTIYWGHPQGKAERKAILQWAQNLDKGKYHCVYTTMLNQPSCPPEILLITKKH